MSVDAEPAGVRLPPGPRVPRAVLAVPLLTMRPRVLAGLRRRYGPVFSLDMPLSGPCVHLGDPMLIRQLFTTSPELLTTVEPNLGRVLGRRSFFELDGEEHKRQRKLLVPPFHGRRMRDYEEIIAEETRREVAGWPEGRAFPTLPSMMRITLNAILRAVFGAAGAELGTLRRLLPPMITYGSRLMLLPGDGHRLGRWNPWRRFEAYRREFDAVISTLIARGRADPDLAGRRDVLALMLLARYDDGSPMADGDIADQLLTLLAAGHETTATQLAWAFERVRRHPAVLERLADPVFRAATLVEVQRTRPVIDLTSRRVKAETLPIGDWVIPRGHTVVAAISLVHSDDRIFPDAARFDPDRFAGAAPDTYTWIPFGGGTRRCLGAAFATMEMDVVLRTVLDEFELLPTTEPGERLFNRGVAYAPAKGGRAVVRRRRRT
ncbi:cytochrome P450 [Symbioplanes lichenis]|uniref:cytochrome P450 n=1 Tax=Symbioplanes lichenis TaxID=1629072 RepID=UPI002738B2B1|nr:cytochrome P450 [Actinoplanes lichenis]